MTRVCNAGAREHEATIDAGWLLYLSELARQTRRPGQALQSRLQELLREHGIG
jgi:hypothetical protein